MLTKLNVPEVNIISRFWRVRELSPKTGNNTYIHFVGHTIFIVITEYIDDMKRGIMNRLYSARTKQKYMSLWNILIVDI